jgi:hypothetical protein
MSYTKQTLEHFSKSINKIFDETLADNDLTSALEHLNTLLEIKERFTKKDTELEFYWNEIISDTISLMHCGISGQYRLAITGLRNTLELACSAFFYLDHKIELKLYVNEDFKADKYVSSIIHEFHFYKTTYIKTFNSKIGTIQVKEDSVSSYLNLTYAKLCDVVHGRYKSLTKANKLTVEYSKEQFKKFEKSYVCTLGAIATLYVLRFDDFTSKEINDLVKNTNTLNIS